MNKMMAYCGLECGNCPIHLATYEKDSIRQQEMRVSIASFCREHYGMDLQSEDITDCDGCRSDTGRIFSGCLNCEIRKCAIERDLESCAYCTDYACDKLKDFFSRDPGAQANLERLRNAGNIF
jgi:hypothetical protein